MSLVVDGRIETPPGQRVHFCCYTIMHHDTSDILGTFVVKKEDTSKSLNTEMKAFQDGLDYLLANKIIVKEVVTDQHQSIISLMSKYCNFIYGG